MAQPIKTTSYLGPPPSLPSIPGIDPSLAQYLTRFGLWAQGGFNASVQKNSATGALLLASPTGQTVWQVTVDDTGALHTTQVSKGGGP